MVDDVEVGSFSRSRQLGDATVLQERPDLPGRVIGGHVVLQDEVHVRKRAIQDIGQHDVVYYCAITV